MSVSSEKHSPLEQFEISPLIHLKPGGIDLSFTNSSLSMIITVAIITMFLTFSVNTRSIIPSRFQLISELSYNFVASLLKDTIGNEGRKNVLKKFDVEKMCNSTFTEYKKLIQ